MKLAIILSVIVVIYLFGPSLLALPVKWFANYTTKRRLRKFDPEIAVCPACGYRGDERSDDKALKIKFKRTRGPEQAALECICYRCGADSYAPLFKPAKDWLPNISFEELNGSTQQK